jgi:glycerol kinase
MAETTALGAGLLAGIVAGLWRSAADVASLRAAGRVFKPKISARERASLLAGWHAAVAQTLGLPARSASMTIGGSEKGSND